MGIENKNGQNEEPSQKEKRLTGVSVERTIADTSGKVRGLLSGEEEYTPSKDVEDWVRPYKADTYFPDEAHLIESGEMEKLPRSELGMMQAELPKYISYARFTDPAAAGRARMLLGAIMKILQGGKEQGEKSGEEKEASTEKVGDEDPSQLPDDKLMKRYTELQNRLAQLRYTPADKDEEGKKVRKSLGAVVAVMRRRGLTGTVEWTEE